MEVLARENHGFLRVFCETLPSLAFFFNTSVNMMVSSGCHLVVNLETSGKSISVKDCLQWVGLRGTVLVKFIDREDTPTVAGTVP